MTNQAEVFNIPLEGKGFVARQNRDYKPGEFRLLNNCEMVDGRIVGRRNIRKHHESIVEGNTHPDTYGAIGFFNQWTIYVGPSNEDLGVVAPVYSSTQIAYTGTGDRVEMFEPNDMIDLGTEATGFGKIVGFFVYNHKAYWLVFRYNSDVATVGIEIYTADTTGINDPGDFVVGDISLDTSAGFRLFYDNVNFNSFHYNNFFIFKDRLWICTSDGIYFSKATDPSRFEVDNDGGFIRFPDETINYAVAVRDTIYIFGTNKIYAVTYSKTPNDLNDINSRQLTDYMGATHACIYQDTPYFINNEGIFSINNSSIEKILTSDFDEGLNNFNRQTLTPFQDYLIVNKTYIRNTEGLPHPDGETAGVSVLRNNLMPDPSFRDDPNTYWTPIDATDTIASITGIPVKDANDTHVLRQTVGASGGLSGFTTDTAERIPCTSGVQYTVSGWVRRPAATAFVAGDAVGFSATVYNAAGTSLISYTAGATLLTASDTWIGFSGTFAVSAGYAAASMSFRVDLVITGATAGKIYYFDAFMVEEASSVGTYFDGFFPDTPTETYTNLDGTGTVSAKVNVMLSPNPAFRYYLNLFPYRNDVSDYGNALGYNTYFINMTNGSMHVLDYHARLNYGGGDDYFEDSICEVTFNPNVDPELNLGSLMLRTTTALESFSTDPGVSEVVYMESERNINVWDEIRYIKNPTPYTYREVMPYYQIEFTVSPDVHKYLTKKFRNLEVMGIFPKESFELVVSYDNSPPSTAVEIVDDKSGLAFPRAHYPHRIGLNQRGNSVTIYFYASQPTHVLAAGEPYPYDFLEISNMRLLYTLTGRDTKYKSLS